MKLQANYIKLPIGCSIVILMVQFCFKVTPLSMKLILSFLTLIAVCCSCNTSPKEPAVLLVGTVHNATNKINADSIYKVLEQFRPDMILIELDSSFFYDDFTYKTLFDGNEVIATTRYKMHHPEVAIRPIEFEGRETYREQKGLFPEIPLEFGGAIEQLTKTRQLTATDQQAIDKLLYYDSIISQLKQADLKTINTTATDMYVDSLNFYKYEQLSNIAKRYPIFLQPFLDAANDSSILRDNFLAYAYFEAVQRNEALSNHATAFIKANPTKRIVILVGFAHRSYVRKALTAQKINVVSNL